MNKYVSLAEKTQTCTVFQFIASYILFYSLTNSIWELYKWVGENDYLWEYLKELIIVQQLC